MIAGATLAVALLCLGSFDYARQARAAGQSLSEFGLSGWANSYAARGHAAGLRTYIRRSGGPVELSDVQIVRSDTQFAPEDGAPEGPQLRAYFPQQASIYQRTDWTAAHDYLFFGDETGLTDAQLMALGREGELSPADRFLVLTQLDPKRSRPELDGQRVVYQFGRLAVGVTVVVRPALFGSRLFGAKEEEAEGLLHSVHHGVAFRDITRPTAAHSVRLFKAAIGDQIEIYVRANTSDTDLKRVLSQLDYAGLNALQKHPVEGIGEGADPTRHLALLEALRSDRPAVVALAESRRDLMERRLFRLTRDARERGWLGQQVCVDFDGEKLCKLVQDLETEQFEALRAEQAARDI